MDGFAKLILMGVGFCVIYIGAMLVGSFMYVSAETAIMYLAAFWVMLIVIAVASKYPYIEDGILALIICVCLNLFIKIHSVFNMLIFVGLLVLFIRIFENNDVIGRIKGWFFTGIYLLVGSLLIWFRMDQLDNIWRGFFIVFFAVWCWMGRQNVFAKQEKDDPTVSEKKPKHYRPDAPELHSIHIALMEQTSGILLEDKIGNDASRLKTGTKQEYYKKRKEAYKTYIEKYYNDEPEPLTEKFVKEYEKALALYKKEVDKIDKYYLKDNA